MLISRKDYEARKLEKAEEKILKRLKEAHKLQQETIKHIQNVFGNSPAANVGIGQHGEESLNEDSEAEIGADIEAPNEVIVAE